MVNYLLVLFIAFFISGTVIADSWHTQQLRKIESNNKCEPVFGSLKSPFPFIRTPSYHLSWCKRANENTFNLIVLSSKENPDWDSCGEFVELQEPYNNQILYIEQSASPYEKPLPLYKFWTIESSKKNGFDFIDSGELATNKAIYFGEGGILYCHKKQWVISGYH